MSRFALLRRSLALIVAALICGTAAADDRVIIGGDAYVSGVNAALADPSPRNAFLSGFSVFLTGTVEKDVTAAGFDVDIEAPVGRNLTAAGATVRVAQPVAEDVTAAGGSLHIRKDAPIGGNARLAGRSILLDAPVSGSLVAAAGWLTVNGTIAGDARLTAGKLTFGPNARIGGVLTYSATEPIEIAPAVVPPERVRFEAIGRPAPRFRQILPALFFGFALSLALLVAAAALLLTAAPQLVEGLRQEAAAAPFRSIALGILVLGLLAGLVPVGAMTLIGIPLIPIVMLAIIAAWIAGYLLGAYVLTARAAGAFREIPATLAARLAVLTAGLVLFATLNFVPIIGWLINLAIVFLGLGAIATWSARTLANRRAGSLLGTGSSI